MLDKDEIAAIRRGLLTRAEALRGERNDKLGQARSDAGPIAEPGDAGDHSSAENARDIDLAEADRDRVEGDQIRAAITRIDDGDYGTCTDCGQEIPAQRLRAQPLASRCVACQERVERALPQHRSSL